MKKKLYLSKSDPGCLQDRGGQIFYPYASSSWDPVGRYSLGADRELGNHGYADYGLDTLTVGVAGPNVTSSIIGAFNGTNTINNTYYITGLFGLGLGAGTFNNDITPVPALNALVKTEGKVPGNSYGFTAGAHYREFIHVLSVRKLAEKCRTRRRANFLNTRWLRCFPIDMAQRDIRFERSKTTTNFHPRHFSVLSNGLEQFHQLLAIAHYS